MATNIFNYNGSLLTTVQDGTISTTACSLALPGRAYQNYGEAVDQDMLWILQNFSNPSSPLNPVVGQLWFDSANQLLKFYSGSIWIVAGGVFLGPSPPSGTPQIGNFWYDTVNKQLHIWSGTNWDLLGPLGSAINTDPENSAVPAFSLFDAVRVTDSTTAIHQIWRFTVGGSTVAILSKDSVFVPSPTIAGFATISPGFNISTAISAAGYYGDPALFRGSQTNLPTITNTWNLGSESLQFADIYSTNFIGTASQALYADLAERYKSDVPLSPGTVVILGGSAEITVCRNYGDDGIFGVISTTPAYLMNSGAGNDNTYPAVALVGRVPCMVQGPVYKGQRVMGSNTPGVAQAWDSAMGSLSILGRSLVELTSNETKLIEVVLGKN